MVANNYNLNSMDIVIGLCHYDRIDIDTFSESVGDHLKDHKHKIKLDDVQVLSHDHPDRVVM